MAEITWLLRTLIVPATIVEQCRALCAAATPAGDGMFTTPLSATGAIPATHYISSGMIDEAFAALLDSPEAMHEGLTALDIEVDLATCQTILSACDVSKESGTEAMERRGLRMVSEEVG